MMSCTGRLCLVRNIQGIAWRTHTTATQQTINMPATTHTNTANQVDEQQFTKLDLHRGKSQGKFVRRAFKKRHTMPVRPPRSEGMAIDQDWTSVWPAARSFNPNTVPLPVRQGFPHCKSPPPDKFGNAELIKIPNFLHLTPPAIKQQCQAIKKFCTPWPAELETEADCEAHFPVHVTSSDYLHSSPSIRDIRARIVTFQINVEHLELDAHSLDKLLRLVGKRYNEKTNILTITAERCPMRKQNYDYVMYLLTALYHESWKVEPWEHEKESGDYSQFVWDDHEQLHKTLSLLNNMKVDPPPYMQDAADITADNMEDIPQVNNYKHKLTQLYNDKETIDTVEEYGEAVRELLALRA